MEQGTGEQNPLFKLAIDTAVTSEIMPKQINTLPIALSNEFQLLHDSGR